ncbi:MAG: 3-phosphoshikimate 1-carboxyvinyltransferase [Planctomycetes bacterium]|nr:3-phosphoshikimate 1-carboxyvinyltransferase [Planctomycetota bacterium]
MAQEAPEEGARRPGDGLGVGAASRGPLVGESSVPGDKSVTHRALLLGALAEGETRVRGALDAGDTRSTAGVVRALGASVAWDASDACCTIVGVEAPRSPPHALDCGNAGTLARLLLGLLAGHAGRWTFDGDASLRGRPMGRVVRPLAGLGADLRGERLPLELRGSPLRGGRVEVHVPSAQVKSALMLAALRADAPLTVAQHVATRDHTERLLPRFGLRVEREPGAVTVHPGRPRGTTIDVPGDPSAAAFLVVAALLVPGSELVLRDVGLWPRRTGFLRALDRAGADVTPLRVRAADDASDDPRGDLRVVCGELEAFEIAPDDVPDLVDELPALAIAAARARGTSRFAGLGELRVKESDRVLALAELLATLGVPVRVDGDALTITGVTRFVAAPSTGHDDHRIALAAAVARLVMGAALPAEIPSADVSFPGFVGAVERLRAPSARTGW